MPQALSHGTLECNEKEASNRFYTEVLGLEIVGGGQSSTYIAHPDAPWYIVVLPRPERNYLAPVNRFTLKLASPDEVRDAHGSFADAGAELGVTELWDLRSDGDEASFIFADLDRNWWELTSTTAMPRS